ncbi:hypothetical protein [Lactococcus garvieae]|uniref:Uncharacterized protein n=1 Tax=Lactococcus garvieae TaxID=1363 RepID=A0A1I4I7Z6_9LACT|nr:hypothetical protein [Lactococcus garvieae]SFL49836.1 hypothetical protein SAMN05216438_11337 [Lactococcus garvieae]
MRANKYEEVWTRIMFEKIEVLSNKTAITRTEMKQGVITLVKGLNAYFNKEISAQNDAEYINKVWNNFHLCEITMNLIGSLTPKELMEIFPIEKIYDGKKYQTKDWFSAHEAVQQLAQETPISESKEVFDFLWDYHNWDLHIFTVNVIASMNNINKMEKGRGLLEQFLEEQGVRTINKMDMIDVNWEEERDGE